MGRVKYIIIKEKELFIENLVRLLIRQGVNYVLIDNEIHFLDNIVRVLDPVEDRYLIMEELLEKNSTLVGNDYIKKLLNKKEEDYFDLINDDALPVPEKEEKVYQKTNFKFNNRRNNKMINNRLKGNRNINLDRR